MKILLVPFLLSLLIVWTGCRSPAARAAKDLARVAKAQAAARDVREAAFEEAKGAVYAAGKALDRVTNAPPAVTLARGMSERAQLTLGLPSATEGLAWSRMVDQLLSEKEADRLDGLKALAERDAKIGFLESKLKDKQDAIASAEVRRDKDLLTFAKEAQAYLGWKRIFYFAVFIMLSLFLGPPILNAIGAAFPGGSILTSAASGFVSMMAKNSFRAVPAAAEKAGYIVREAYDETRDAAAGMVSAIAKFKASNPAEFRSMLAPHLNKSDVVADLRKKV